MKHPWHVTGTIALVLGALASLSGCPPEPARTATLSVQIGQGFPAMNGHMVYASVYDHGAAFGVENPIAGNSAVFNGSLPNLPMLVPSTSTTWEGVDRQRYDLYVWCDLNDNYATVKSPESGIDYRLRYFPWEVVLLAPSWDMNFWSDVLVVTP